MNDFWRDLFWDDIAKKKFLFYYLKLDVQVL